MTDLASPGQLRVALLRWTLFLSPLLLILGFFAGALANSGADNLWFSSLVKPALYPPPATFAIVWSALYLIMGLALALVMTARGAPGRQAALFVFVGQFVLNLAWSPLFFGLHQLHSAFYLLVALDLALIATLLLFYRVRPMAAGLLLPYLCWVLFATVLNWQFIQVNPG